MERMEDVERKGNEYVKVRYGSGRGLEEWNE
jgi:hypothetical protein